MAMRREAENSPMREQESVPKRVFTSVKVGALMCDGEDGVNVA